MRIEPGHTRGLRLRDTISKGIRIARIGNDQPLKSFAVEPEQIENRPGPGAVIKDAGSSPDDGFA